MSEERGGKGRSLQHEKPEKDRKKRWGRKIGNMIGG